MLKIFNTKSELYTNGEIGSNLTEGFTFKDGNLEGTGNISLNCIFCGNIDINGEVIIEPVGTVIGSIIAKSVTIQGTVNGNITASESVNIEHEGQLSGNVECKTFEISGGGVFSGYCNMQNSQKNLVSFVPGKSTNQNKPIISEIEATL